MTGIKKPLGSSALTMWYQWVVLELTRFKGAGFCPETRVREELFF